MAQWQWRCGGGAGRGNGGVVAVRKGHEDGNEGSARETNMYDLLIVAQVPFCAF